MRRILLLITDLQVGGTPTVVRELARRLRVHCHIEVACLAGWGPVADQIEHAGVAVTALGASSPLDLKIVGRLLSLMRDRGFDTVFSFLVHANAMAAAASIREPGVRYLQSIQTTQPSPRWHWWVQRLIHPAAERIVVPSSSAAAAALEWSAIPAEKITIIPNAIDPAEFANLHGQPSARPFPIGFIGRLDPIKRVEDLLESVRILNGAVVLHIFGEGSQRVTIEQRIRELHIEPWVRMHGTIEHPRHALEQIRLLALPSDAEGFGLVLIEAMAAGIPVVATNVPGIRDVVKDGLTGLLVPPRQPPSLAEAIARVMRNETLRERLIARAAVDVEERFTWASVLPRYRRLLDV